MKMYRILSYSTEVEEREIIKVTDKSVFYITSRGREDRELKCSNYYKWFNTREEAVEALKKRISDTIASHEANIVRLKFQLASIV